MKVANREVVRRQRPIKVGRTGHSLTLRLQQEVDVIAPVTIATTEHINVSLRQLRAGQAPEPVEVKPGDILYVPPAAPPSRTNIWRTLRDGLWIVGTLGNLLNW